MVEVNKNYPGFVGARGERRGQRVCEGRQCIGGMWERGVGVGSGEGAVAETGGACRLTVSGCWAGRGGDRRRTG